MLDDFSKQKNYRQFLIHQNLTANICLRNRYCHATFVPNRLFESIENLKIIMYVYPDSIMRSIYVYIVMQLKDRIMILFSMYLNIDHISFIIRIKILLIQSSFCCLPGLFIYTWLEYTYGYTCQD